MLISSVWSNNTQQEISIDYRELYLDAFNNHVLDRDTLLWGCMLLTRVENWINAHDGQKSDDNVKLINSFIS